MLVVAMCIYLGVGGVAAVLLRARSGPGASWIGLVVFWPFLLPARLAFDTAPRDDREVTRAVRAAEAALVRLAHAPPDGKLALTGFRAALEARARRREELLCAAADAPVSVQAQLSELAEVERARIEAGIRILDELTAQLTLLRFTAHAAGEGEAGEPVEVLLLRVQSQIEVMRTASR